MTGAIEEMGSLFYLVLIDVNLKSHMWLMATVLQSTDLRSAWYTTGAQEMFA